MIKILISFKTYHIKPTINNKILMSSTFAFNIDDFLTGAKDTHDIIKNVSNILNDVSSNSYNKKDLVCDIYQDNDSYYIYVDVPGCTKENVKIDIVDDKKVTISATRQRETLQVICKETVNRTLKRQIELPELVSTITATCVDGVLKIKLRRLINTQNSRSVPVY